MRIALIHAVPAALVAAETAFRQLWPAPERVNLLDDALGLDRERAGSLTPALAARIDALADYAVGLGARGVLFTCSAFGAAIDAAARRSRVPVLKPNEAMFAEALGCGQRIGLLATFPSAVGQMTAELEEAAGAAGRAVEIVPVCVPQAFQSLKAGAADRHDALIAAAADGLARCDVVLLAQFSMAHTADAVAARSGRPVLTSPAAAVRRLRRLLEGAAAPP